MNRIHVIGRKNHGKTRLVVELIEEFTSRGLRIASIKHTHHRHELDVPGKDSYKHRAAGAVAAGILSRDMSAVFVPAPQHPSAGDRYERLAAMMGEFDLVIVEGDSQASAMKIEVWRAALATEPLAARDDAIRAVVTDDADSLPANVTAATCPRDDVTALADWIWTAVLAG